MMAGILRGCLKTGWNSNGGGRGLDSIGDSAAGGTRLRVHAPLTVTTIRGGLLRADLNDELREKGAGHAAVTN